MKIQDVRELIRLIDKSTIDEFKYEQDGVKLSLKKKVNVQEVSEAVVQEKVVVPPPKQVQPSVMNQPQSEKTKEVVNPKEAPVESQQANLHKITSPMVGTFYAAPAPDADPYVKAGDVVKEESVVCIVEAMKLMNEIEAEINGKVVEVLVENGQLVEYGQPLFLVQPE